MELTEAPPDDAAAATPSTPPAANNARAAWIVAGVATAVALVAAMVAVSAVMHKDNANPLNAGGVQAGFNRPVAGTIQSLDGSSFSVKETGFNGQSVTTQVSTNAKTKYRALVNGTLADLKVGDTVSVAGTTTDNVYSATRITETDAQTNVVRGAAPQFGTSNAPPGQAGNAGGGPQFFRSGGGDNRIGKISQIVGDTITLSALDGTTVTVKTTASTVVRVSKTISRGSLKVGDTVRVIGTVDGSKVTADQVTKGADDALVP